MADVRLSWPKRLAAIGILSVVPLVGACEADPGDFPEDGFEDTIPEEPAP